MEPRDLSDHVEYVPGRGIEEVARDLDRDPDGLVKLSSNENPHGASPAAVEAVRRAAPDVSVYPKAARADLTETLAARWDVAPEQVWVAPGADGAIDYLTRAMLDPGDEVLVPDPGFTYYGMSARFHHGELAAYPVERADDFALTAAGVLEAYGGERMVYVTSPHNPTGTTMAREELERLLAGVDDETLVVVDEAYGEFAEEDSAAGLLAGHVDPDGPNGGAGNDDLAGYDNLAVLRTFSKAYGLAGLRIGYALVPAPWADAYARVSTPFAASEIALRAAITALDDDDHVERSVESARWAREYVREELEAPTYESEANFVLCEVGDGTAVSEAAQREGIIVRDCTSFGLPGCIRLSCGTEADTRRAIETLNEILAARGEDGSGDEDAGGDKDGGGDSGSGDDADDEDREVRA